MAIFDKGTKLYHKGGGTTISDGISNYDVGSPGGVPKWSVTPWDGENSPEIGLYGLTVKGADMASGKPISADSAYPFNPPVPTYQPTEQPDTSASVKSDLEKQRKANEDAYQAELDRIRTEKEERQKKEDSFTSMINTALGEAQPLTAPFREDLEASERRRLKVEENYFANQALTNELDGLLTESIEMTRKLESQKVPGLAGLQQSERLTRAKEGVQSRIAVIQAVMSARDNQIGTAFTMIDRTTNAITQDRQDRINYLNTLVNWYDKQRTEEGNKILDLSKEEKAMIDKQIGLLEADLGRTQQVADKIKDLMITDSQLVAEAGLSLNDSLEGISKKLADAEYAREVKNEKNEFEQKGFRVLQPGQTAPTGTTVIKQIDSRGVETSYYKELTPEELLDLQIKRTELAYKQKQLSLLGEPSDADKKKEQELLASSEGIKTSLQDKIDTINTIVGEDAPYKVKLGKELRVGPNSAARKAQGLEWLNPLTLPTQISIGALDTTGAGQAFAGAVHRIASQEFLDKLINVKGQGATFGALTDREGDALRASATQINDWELKNDKGIGIGVWNVSQSDFDAELNRIKKLAQKAISDSQKGLLTSDEQLLLDTVFSQTNVADFYK